MNPLLIQSARAFITKRAATGRQTDSERWTRTECWRVEFLSRQPPVSSAAPVTLHSHSVEQLSFIRWLVGWLVAAGEDWSLYLSCWLTAGTVSGLISHYDNQCLLSAQRTAGPLLFAFVIHTCVCVCVWSPDACEHPWLLQSNWHRFLCVVSSAFFTWSETFIVEDGIKMWTNYAI